MANRATERRGIRTRRRFLAAASPTLAAAVAGCPSNGGEQTPTAREVSLTVDLRNRDAVPREYEVVVRQGESVRNEFSGVLPADQSRHVEMTATFRQTDEQYEFTVSSEGGQRGRTWDPSECGTLFVDAAIRDGEPAFETECRSG